MRLLVVSVALTLGCQGESTPSDAMGDALPETPRCSTVQMLGDDFSGPLEYNWLTSATTIWPVAGETIAVTQMNNKLSMTATAGEFGDGVLTSRFFYDLRDDAFTIDVTANVPMPTDSSFQLRAVPRTSIGAALEQATMGLRVGPSGEQQLFGTRDSQNQTVSRFAVDFDPVRDKIWRFAQSGEELIWSTGPTVQGPFTIHYSERLPEYDFVRFEAFVAARAGGPISMTLDDAAGGMRTGVACSAMSLHDSFPQGRVDPQWSNSRTRNCTLMANNGLMFTSIDQSCEIGTATIYDLRDAAIVVGLSALSDVQRVDIALTGSTEAFGWSIAGPSTQPTRPARLSAYATAGELATTAYDPELRFFRISATTDRIDWAVSVDGVTFQPFANTTATGLDRLALTISVGGPSYITIVRVN